MVVVMIKTSIGIRLRSIPPANRRLSYRLASSEPIGERAIAAKIKQLRALIEDAEEQEAAIWKDLLANLGATV